MAAPKKSYNRMREAAQDGDLQGVFSALALRASEDMRPENQGGSGDVPDWLVPVLRCWVNLERGVLEHGGGEDGEGGGGGDDGGLRELGAALTAITGGKS